MPAQEWHDDLPGAAVAQAPRVDPAPTARAEPAGSQPHDDGRAPDIGIERLAYKMVVSHNVLWSGFDQVRRAVAEPGEVTELRAHGLYRHYQMMARAVLRHHAYEAKHVWPTLVDRAPETEPHVQLVLRHERELNEALVPLQPLWNAWMSSPDLARAEALSRQLDIAASRLARGFDDEERHLLGALDSHLTEDEWLAFGRDGAKDSPTGELMVTAGLMYQQLSRAEIDSFASHARLLFWFFRWVAEPYYRRYARALRLPTARGRHLSQQSRRGSVPTP